MRRWFGIWVGTVLAVGLLACKSSAPGYTGSLPAQADGLALAAGLSENEAVVARKLCVTKCLSCHKFYDPTGYTEVQWHSWMKKMSKKARLAPDQQDLLSRYLAAFRRGSKDDTPP